MSDYQVDLVADIRADANLVILLADNDFCAELWTAFANITWFKAWDPSMADDEKCMAILRDEHLGRTASESFRSMGGLIADLRNALFNKGEDYVSWYCSNSKLNLNIGFVTERVRTALAAIGWYPVKDEYYLAANID
jgi:hypothetical protein